MLTHLLSTTISGPRVSITTAHRVPVSLMAVRTLSRAAWWTACRHPARVPSKSQHRRQTWPGQARQSMYVCVYVRVHVRVSLVHATLMQLANAWVFLGVSSKKLPQGKQIRREQRAMPLRPTPQARRWLMFVPKVQVICKAQGASHLQSQHRLSLCLLCDWHPPPLHG
jgi:hypothetical protein